MQMSWNLEDVLRNQNQLQIYQACLQANIARSFMQTPNTQQGFRDALTAPYTGFGNALHSVHSMAFLTTCSHRYQGRKPVPLRCDLGHQIRNAQHSTAQHSTAQHSTAQHSTTQHSTAQHSIGTCASRDNSQAENLQAKQQQAKQLQAKKQNTRQEHIQR